MWEVFFKNPTVKKDDINITNFSLDDLIIWNFKSKEVKVGAARLIQLIKSDLKKHRNVSIYSKHALVLISNGNASQKEVLNFANEIKDIVNKKFNISLQIEPTVIN